MEVIEHIHARQVLDSRGKPTVEVEMFCGADWVRAITPSGASTGEFEAVELRDGGEWYFGQAVNMAVRHVNELIAPKLVGVDVFDQSRIDEMLLHLDGTPNKAKLGANAILPVSIAAIKMAAIKRRIAQHQYIAEIADTKQIKIPLLFINVINGGLHADSDLDIQEHWVIPRLDTLSLNIEAGVRIYNVIGKLIRERYDGPATNVGDEGGFAPPMKKLGEPFDLMLEAITQTNLVGKVKLGVDMAATNIFDKESRQYTLQGKQFKQDEFVEVVADMVDHYDLFAIEDPFHEHDFKSFAALMDSRGDNRWIIADDLTVTNIALLKKAEALKACNSLIIKPNQIGTITEVIETTRFARSHGIDIVVSHRSGETEDPFISALAVGLGADGFKLGAPARGERTAKYNELIRIDELMRRS